MFVLFATVILCWFKHACAPVNIYFNDIQIYWWIYCISYIDMVTVKTECNLFLKVNNTSIFLTQVKPFSSITFPIISISITVSHSNTLQAERLNYFAQFSDCSAKITNFNCITTISPRFFLITQDNFWPYALCSTN